MTLFAGYAYMDAECKAKSVSVVEDNDDFYTAQLIAHEIGHRYFFFSFLLDTHSCFLPIYTEKQHF